MSYIPPAVIKLFDSLKIEVFFDWVKGVKIFFSNPFRFFNSFFAKPLKDQILQIIFYLVVGSALPIIFMPGSTTFFHIPVSLIITSIPISMFISVPVSILSRGSFNFWHIFSFVLVTLTLASLPAFIFLYLFITTENYTFQLLANSIDTVGLLFVFTGYFLLLYRRKYKKLGLSILISLLLANLLMIAASFIFIDRTSRLSGSDAIVQEFDSKLNSLGTQPKVPVQYKETHFPDGHLERSILLANAGDTILSQEEFESLKKRISSMSDQIDTFKLTLFFETNKTIFGDIRNYYSQMNESLSRRPCDSCLISREIKYIKSDSQIVSVSYYYLIDTSSRISLRKVTADIDELQRKSNLALTPDVIPTFALYPSYAFLNWLGRTKSSQLTIYW